MGPFFDRLWNFLTSTELFLGVLSAGLAALSATLLVLMWTRWGQSRPLRKCLILSLVAHVLLLGYSTTVHIFLPDAESPGEPAILVSLADVESPNEEEWEATPDDAATQPEPNEPNKVETLEPPEPRPTPPPTQADAAEPRSSVPMVEPPQPTPAPDKPTEPIAQQAADADEAMLRRLLPASLASPDARDGDLVAVEAAEPGGRMVSVGAPPVSLHRSDDTAGVPEVYRLRVAADRDARAREHGATAESEAAVNAGLKWLADHQEPDGRWCPAHYEGSRETFVAGEDRGGATMQADAGITGLALLAFLAAGHTSERSEYEGQVERGLEYLVRVQKPDGSLAGEANLVAAMYCHAMAALAIGEAYAMTSDPRFEGPLRRAVAYTVAAQDPSGGGWRYRPRDPGDTSQLGWQVMVLASAESSGIPIPETARQAARHYLRAVSSGRYGGLAAYRVGQRASRPMTAEALVCRQFLGIAAESPTAGEAGDYLLGELPGQGRDNLYYWYYGTLAMYHLQGEHWRQWNDAMQRTLLARQRRSGDLAGSWDPTTVWGSYGGRVYTTAMATLCLEVYYRFLPVYTVPITADRRQPDQTR
jgi:hypothetical protein